MSVESTVADAAAVKAQALRPLSAEDLDARVAPSVTGLPMALDRDGDWVGWGHIDPLVFAATVDALGAWCGLQDAVPTAASDVEHGWAITTTAPHDERGRWQFTVADADAAGAWPITRVRVCHTDAEG